MISEFSERYTGCCATKSFEKQKVNVGINQKDDAGLWDTSTPTTSGRKIKNTTHICISSPSPLPLFIAWAHCYEFAPGLIGLMNINLFSRDDKLFFKNFHNKWLTLCLFLFFFPPRRIWWSRLTQTSSHFHLKLKFKNKNNSHCIKENQKVLCFSSCQIYYKLKISFKLAPRWLFFLSWLGPHELRKSCQILPLAQLEWSNWFASMI